MPARLAALNRLTALPGVTERDDILCMLNALCAEAADRCFHDTPGRRADMGGPAAGQDGWGVRIETTRAAFLGPGHFHAAERIARWSEP